jgi:hypothetical protein
VREDHGAVSQHDVDVVLVERAAEVMSPLRSARARSVVDATLKRTRANCDRTTAESVACCASQRVT